ncbi:MAG TPA: AAA family ATPase [Candidatus Baltobacteraceae bacterium]|nr:AAA family ATPase [Candidatus Baltobacteraceae bacterium]
MVARRGTELRPIDEALLRPSGAHFFRCALQVNPYAYLLENAKRDDWGSEEAYNAALIESLRAHNVSVIAVTDHHRIASAAPLLQAAESAGIAAFPGFEAETKEGVHLLCLFSRETSLDIIERYLGDCGVYESTVSAPCRYDLAELLERLENWSAVGIAAHSTGEKGLLVALKGTARAKAWKDARLMAVGIPTAPESVQQQFRKILLNAEPAYFREQRLALLNCNDISSPSDVQQTNATTYIKMTAPSIEGLRQAFLDPESRIRLNSSVPPEERSEIVAIAWEGGFLDGLRLHFNEDLNVLIGGRGTGKSTIIESIRYALNAKALGADAQDAHEKVIRNVVGAGTRISVSIDSHRPARKRYFIERTVPNAPVVRDEAGSIVNVAPLQLISGLEIFGQHEITEVTRTPPALTELLSRFAEPDAALAAERAGLFGRLDQSRSNLLNAQREAQRIADRVAVLPSLRETQKRYQEAGVEERLQDQALIVREEQVFRTFGDRIARVEAALRAVEDVSPIDGAFLSETALQELPGRETLLQLTSAISVLQSALTDSARILRDGLVAARSEERRVYALWSARKEAVQSRYEKILRDLHKSKIDGEEFIRLRRQIEELVPLLAQQERLLGAVSRLLTDRQKLLAEWDDLVFREFRRLDAAAKRISRRLGNRLRVSVQFMADHEPLYAHLKKAKFRDPETPQPRDTSAFSLRDFADAVAKGAEAVLARYRYTAAQADRLVDAGTEWRMKLEELYLPPSTTIELNIGSERTPNWRRLSDLSTGQKATAVLLLLLIDPRAPLVVDQPEDDLDNRFISDSVVPRIRDAKHKRQFIFATHNANIPVLGDAELIAGLTAVGEAGENGQAELADSRVGSIDTPSVAMFAEEVLEGGKEAFNMRKQKYGF